MTRHQYGKPGWVNSPSDFARGSDGDPGALIDGVSVDVDDVLAPDFGQWDLLR